MKKFLVITENKKKSLLYRIAEKFILSESFYCTEAETEDIINSYKPDYVLFDVIKPVNGEDMMSMLRHIDGNIRLRVAIFYIGYSKKELFRLRSVDRMPSVKKAAH
ncbi:MAG: hypothetical protein R6W90_03925 [Ignavibacteriaceae bacterium]